MKRSYSLREREDARRLGTCVECGCGDCCTTLELGVVDPADVDRIGREWFYQKKKGGWYIRRVQREFAPSWATDGVCIFLTADRRCSIFEERPSLCRDWNCCRRAWPERIEFAKGQLVGLKDGQRRQLRERYKFVEYWYQGVHPPPPSSSKATACRAVC
ncbi:MAG: YkgJ family cysteine cluster protein [Gemmatimonadota bacterium]|nr:MAG: YkgJ family cysteine cluster protein [Gemmatimonadota bacterium]